MITAALGPAVTAIPLGALRLVVGGVLLVFGLQWLRKAVLRAAGTRTCTTRRRSSPASCGGAGGRIDRRFAVTDWYAFTLSFKGVLLEGLEVVFIVLTFGANQHDVPLAALAAVVAVVLVVAASASRSGRRWPGCRRTP